jgi:hypothetical protein
MEVWLGNERVMVRVVGGWPAGFWGLWCQDATRVVVAGRIDFVMEGMVDDGWECGIVAEVVAADDEGCGCVAEVEGWCWYDAVFDRAEALASVPNGEGYRHCTITLQILLALC